MAAVDDQMYDFYLLKVTFERVEELDQEFTDYAFTALWGTQVLKGFFYCRPPKEPAIIISTLLLPTHALQLFTLFLTQFSVNP